MMGQTKSTQNQVVRNPTQKAALRSPLDGIRLPKHCS
jgi:hypothetical protein